MKCPYCSDNVSMKEWAAHSLACPVKNPPGAAVEPVEHFITPSDPEIITEKPKKKKKGKKAK